MPGVLKRPDDYKGSHLNEVVVGAKVVTMNGDGARKRKAEEMLNGGAQPNGVVPTVNGVYANGAVRDPTASPEQLAATVQKIVTELPPEIMHITEGYLPLSRLITRLAQDTFNGMTETITEMAEMQPQQAKVSGYLNGISSSQLAQSNVNKKTKLWDFAQDRRAKFIKILVLSQWARQAESVGKVIDLNYWMNVQKANYNDATNWIGRLKAIVEPMKVPSPDLETALSALSTGKADWISDLGYIPPKPLSPQQILKALRNINTLLTIRLNLHETVPPHMKNFSIADGRATFKIEDEFELDLSIADEDPASQLYFIDFRFAFSPCPTELPEGPLRDEIENKTNDILRREGLAACYDFLHEFVLTHKISILRNQAFDLLRGRWSENIGIEPIHRSLVVQYWLNRPGGKSWIEIGIKSGKGKEPQSSSITPGLPHIGIRWHRNGKEVFDPELEIDLKDLSMEEILNDVILLHINHIFKETKRKLREARIYSTKRLTVKHRASHSEPSNCTLKIQVTDSTTVTVVIEPVTGAFAIMQPSNLHLRIERDLNYLRDPAADAASRLAHLRCITAMEQIETRARIFGWQKNHSLTPNQETTKRLFGADTMRLSFFQPFSWDKLWAIGATTSMTSDSWWLIALQDPQSTHDPLNTILNLDQSIQHAFRIPTATTTTTPFIIAPTYPHLGKVETLAAAILAHYTDHHHLSTLSIPHTQIPPRHPSPHLRIPDLLIRYPTSALPQTPWCHPLIRLRILGLALDRRSLSSLVLARLRLPIPNISLLTSTTDHPDIAFHPTSGAFAFRLLTPIGASSVPAILDRFARIEKLVAFLATIRRNGLRCQKVSLSELVFEYGERARGSSSSAAAAAAAAALGGDTKTTGSSEAQTDLTATLTFAPPDPIRLSFPTGNSHLRIQDFLATEVNAKSGFERVTLMLRTTLPLLRAFDAVDERVRRSGARVFVLPRSASWYRVLYRGGGWSWAWEVRLRERAGRAVWWGGEAEGEVEAGGGGEGVGEGGKEGLERGKRVREEWKRVCGEKGVGWMGLRGGVVAEVEGVRKLVERVDEMVRRVEEEEEVVKGEGGAKERVGVKTEGENRGGKEKRHEVVVLD